eukprot:scaffold88197_cov37-Cyclotella_meneghiniana.AAC.4
MGRDCGRGIPWMQDNKQIYLTSPKGGLPRVRLFKIRRERNDDYHIREDLTNKITNGVIHFDMCISAALEVL